MANGEREEAGGGDGYLNVTEGGGKEGIIVKGRGREEGVVKVISG